MIKRDFMRGEKVIDNLVDKVRRDELLKKAEEEDAKKEGNEIPKANAVVEMLQQVRKDLITLSRREFNIIEKIGIQNYQIDNFLKDPTALTPDDWQFLKQIKREIEKCKNELEEQEIDDEDVIKKERYKIAEKSENLNVKKGWKPV